MLSRDQKVSSKYHTRLSNPSLSLFLLSLSLDPSPSRWNRKINSKCPRRRPLQTPRICSGTAFSLLSAPAVEPPPDRAGGPVPVTRSAPKGIFSIGRHLHQVSPVNGRIGSFHVMLLVFLLSWFLALASTPSLISQLRLGLTRRPSSALRWRSWVSLALDHLNLIEFRGPCALSGTGLSDFYSSRWKGVSDIWWVSWDGVDIL